MIIMMGSKMTMNQCSLWTKRNINKPKKKQKHMTWMDMWKMKKTEKFFLWESRTENECECSTVDRQNNG